MWGEFPYRKYVFLNVFRRGRGGLEHGNSTLLTTSAQVMSTQERYRSWLSFAAHEYFHSFNVKRLRPVELGPFDFESPPRTSSLWLSEGVTSYFADLFVARAGLMDREQYLAPLSSAIGRRTFGDVMHLAYQRYGGERGFTAEEFQATAFGRWRSWKTPQRRRWLT